MIVEVFQWQVVARRIKVCVDNLAQAKWEAESGEYDNDFKRIEPCFLDQSYEVLPYEGDNYDSQKRICSKNV